MIKYLLSFILLVMTIYLPHQTTHAKQLHIGFLLDSSGYYASLNNKIKESLQTARESNSSLSNITSHFYYVSPVRQAEAAQTIRKALIDDHCEIIIGPFFYLSESTSKTLLNLQQNYPSTLFLVPFYSTNLRATYASLNLQNSFLLPEKAPNIFLSIAHFLKKTDYNISKMIPLIRSNQTIILTKYMSFEKAMYDSLLSTITKWQKHTSSEVEQTAVSYLASSYIPQTLWYLTIVPGYQITESALKELTSNEITDILNTFRKKTGGAIVSEVSLKASGVNSCKSLPCKTRCCEYYKKHNHECLNKISCP